MDVKQIRKLNLRRLIAEIGSVRRLADLAETNENYLSALASIRPPKTPQGTTRGVGDSLARKLESAAGKEPGWMDHLMDWGENQTMWMEIFSRLPPERQQEAIQYLEFLARKEGLGNEIPEKSKETLPKKEATS